MFSSCRIGGSVQFSLCFSAQITILIFAEIQTSLYKSVEPINTKFRYF